MSAQEVLIVKQAAVAICLFGRAGGGRVKPDGRVDFKGKGDCFVSGNELFKTRTTPFRPAGRRYTNYKLLFSS